MIHRTAIATLVALIVLALDGRAVSASPGETCRHARDCVGDGLVCLADSMTSSTGHCARIRILP